MSAHKIHMVIDLQFGSTGKGLLAGYLAKREGYDTVVCAFAPNAGHTYIDKERGINMMTQQLPTAISSPSVQNVLLGPGSLIHIPTLLAEIAVFKEMLIDKRIMIHPHAGIVTDRHIEEERNMTKIGSTAKGVGAAQIQRIQRNPSDLNIADGPNEAFDSIREWVVTDREYRTALEASESLLIEGAQGFGLSMYHGFYPYTTSRDVTPWQIAADCGIPFSMSNYIQIFGTLRTLPIRVNNRDGWSGPVYQDQKELDWTELGISVERTTVTKLPRRIFTFSQLQLEEALFHCAAYWGTHLFLNFANYLESDEVDKLIQAIETPTAGKLNAPHVAWIGYGPDDKDVVPRGELDFIIKGRADSEGGDAD